MAPLHRGCSKECRTAPSYRYLLRDLDGRFLTESSDASFAAGHQAKMPVIVGAERDLGIQLAATRDELFALFGTDAA